MLVNRIAGSFPLNISIIATVKLQYTAILAIIIRTVYSLQCECMKKHISNVSYSLFLTLISKAVNMPVRYLH